MPLRIKVFCRVDCSGLLCLDKLGQGPPDPLQRELTDRLDLHGVLDLC